LRGALTATAKSLEDLRAQTVARETLFGKRLEEGLQACASRIEMALAAALGVHVISARVEVLRKALKTESAAVRDSVRGLEARVMTAADWQKDRNSEVFSIVALLSKRVVSAERRVEQIEGTFDLNMSRPCRSTSNFEAHDVQQIEDCASKEQIPTGVQHEQTAQ